MSNPHFALAQDQLDSEHKWNWTSHDLANISEIIEGNAQATLALAFEARTANLIAFANACETAHCDNGGAFRQAAERLGLGDTK